MELLLFVLLRSTLFFFGNANKLNITCNDIAFLFTYSGAWGYVSNYRNLEKELMAEFKSKITMVSITNVDIYNIEIINNYI